MMNAGFALFSLPAMFRKLIFLLVLTFGFCALSYGQCPTNDRTSWPVGSTVYFRIDPNMPPEQRAAAYRALDGVIDSADSVFAALRLWQDNNHNGLSEADELRSLSSLALRTLHFDYKESKKVDDHGNQFRYRAKVDDARQQKAGRWAWDVFLVKQ